jgi:hypothetical protein
MVHTCFEVTASYRELRDYNNKTMLIKSALNHRNQQQKLIQVAGFLWALDTVLRQPEKRRTEIPMVKTLGYQQHCKRTVNMPRSRLKKSTRHEARGTSDSMKIFLLDNKLERPELHNHIQQQLREK